MPCWGHSLPPVCWFSTAYTEQNYLELLWLTWPLKSQVYHPREGVQAGFSGTSARGLKGCRSVARVPILLWSLILATPFCPSPWANVELIYNHSSTTICCFPGASSSLPFFPRLGKVQDKMNQLAKQGNAAFSPCPSPTLQLFFSVLVQT